MPEMYNYDNSELAERNEEDMAETQTKVSMDSGGLVAGMLGVLFVGLKLTGHIDWSWWWVTAPFWGPAAFVLAVFAVIGVIYCIGWLLNKIF